MARYCVHLDDVEVEVSGDDLHDESDAIRAAREQSGISDVKHQRCHRLEDLPAAAPVPAAPEADDDDEEKKTTRGRRRSTE